MLARITRLAAVAVFLALAAVAWLAYDVFFNAATSDSPSTGTESSGSEAYTDLEIFEDPNGRFAGRVTIHNRTAQDHWTMVTVNIYNGEQNVGELSGDVTLKPGTNSVLELSGYDEFTEFTDSRVDLTGFPGSHSDPQEPRSTAQAPVSKTECATRLSPEHPRPDRRGCRGRNEIRVGKALCAAASS